jgi:diguanylate cyclase (GGDEF)-like protein
VSPGRTFEQFLRASPMLSEDMVQERLRLAAAAIDGELRQTLIGAREVRVVLRCTADGGFVMSCDDETTKNRDASRLAFLAHHDLLTELPNRVLLRQQLERSLRQGPCAVLCLDLDGFEMLNHSLGHAAGDALLRAVGARLLHQIRADETLARLGGDEFAAVIMGDKDTAMATAARMVAVVSAPFGIDEHVVNTSASVGIAVAPTDGRTHEELLIHADMALYHAKTGGRRRVRGFEPSMGEAMRARRSLEQDLRVALAGDQFELHYQSQVSVRDNSVTGFEALLRWHHPERGWIAPDIFIPIAEESGLIVAIGEWVLGEACREALRWPENIGVAVNVSTVQLRSGDLFQTAAAALRTSGLPAHRLELEVTETSLLDDNASALDVMQRLRAMGVRIALDDFGTGYSSLNYLQSFPFDRIKIDRSFICLLGEDAKALAIVRAITGLGRSLGIPVIAEGVETVEQLEFLTGENCCHAQGFLYSRPVPPAQVSHLLN